MKKHLLITSSITPNSSKVLHIDPVERYRGTITMLRENILILNNSFDNVYIVDNSGLELKSEDVKFFSNNDIKLISYLERISHENTGYLEARIYDYFIEKEGKNIDENDLIFKISGRYSPKNFQSYANFNNGFVINFYPNLFNIKRGIVSSIFSLRFSEFKKFTIQLNKEPFLEPLEIKLQRFIKVFRGESFFIIYPRFNMKSGASGRPYSSIKREKLRFFLSYFFRFGIRLR